MRAMTGVLYSAGFLDFYYDSIPYTVVLEADSGRSLTAVGKSYVFYNPGPPDNTAGAQCPGTKSTCLTVLVVHLDRVTKK